MHGLWGSFPLAVAAAAAAFRLVADHLPAETVNIDNKQYLMQQRLQKQSSNTQTKIDLPSLPRVWNLKREWHFFYQKLTQFVFHKNLKTVEILETSIFHQSSRFPWHDSALHKYHYFSTQCDNLIKSDVKSIRPGVKHINCIHGFNYQSFSQFLCTVCGGLSRWRRWRRRWFFGWWRITSPLKQ